MEYYLGYKVLSFGYALLYFYCPIFFKTLTNVTEAKFIVIYNRTIKALMTTKDEIKDNTIGVSNIVSFVNKNY